MNDASKAVASNGLKSDALGVYSVIFLVISAASPLSVLAGGFPVGMLLGNGAGMPALVLLTLFILLVFSAGYTAMAQHELNVCGFYAFTARGLGGLVGGAAGILALCSYSLLQISLYAIFGDVVADIVQIVFGWVMPWWLIAMMAVFAVTLIGNLGIAISVRIIAVTVIAEYIIIAILDVAIFNAGGAAGINFESFKPSQLVSGSPTAGILFCFAAFIGFEATTIYSEEAKNARRNIPIATFASVLLIGAFYAVSVWALVIAIGSENLTTVLKGMADPTTLIYGVSDRYVGTALTHFIQMLFMLSIFAGLLAFQNAAARYLYALGRDGLLPAQFSRTSEASGSPYISSSAQGIFAVMLIILSAAFGINPILELFNWLSNLATLGMLTLMALCSVAAFRYFSKSRVVGAGIWRTRILPLLSAAILTLVLMICFTHFDALTAGSLATSIALCAIVPTALGLGVLLAVRLRRASPARFARLGKRSG